MKCILLIGAVLVAASHQAVQDDPTIDEIVEEAMKYQLYYDDLDTVRIEGDILYRREDYDALMKEGSGRQKRKAERDTRYRWTNNVILYSIAGGRFSNTDVNNIKKGMAEWEKYTCLKFQQRSSQRNYINIATGGGCSSYVGMIGGAQRVSLDGGCRYHATIVHELGHAVGFQHEQTRPDRDSYVTVNTNNIQSDAAFNFNKYSTSKINDHGVPYDYTSVMHYGPYSFSSNGRPTIVTKDSSYQNIIGRAGGLSFRDIKLANLMYNCAGHCGSKSCPGEGFLGKDCVCYCPGSPLKTCDGSGPGPTNAPPTTGPPSDCKDFADRCAEWAARGECSDNPRYMLTNCKKSCGVCPDCVNDNSNCDYWASTGECDANPNYMRAFCRKACNECYIQ